MPPAEPELRHELKKFRALYEIAIALTADHTLEENLQLVVEKSRELLGADTSYIALCDQERGDVFLHTFSGVKTEAFKRLRLPFGEGLGGLVAKTRRGCIVEDYFSDDRLVRPVSDVVAGEGLVSGAAVPIQMGRNNLGVLFVFNRRRTAFGQADLDTLSLIGNLAAVEISHRRVAQSLQQARDELDVRVAERTARLTRANNLLEEEREKFRILVDESPLGVSLLNPNGGYDYVNPKFAAMFGYAPDEVATGHDWFQKVFPDPAYRRKVKKAWIEDSKEFKKGEARPRIFTVRCKNGEEKIIHFRSVGLRTGYQLVLYEDITERKRAESKLRKSEKRYRDLFNSVSDLIYTQDLEGRFLSINSALAGILGYEQGDLIGRKASDFMRPDLRPLFESEYLEALKTQGSHDGVSLYFHRNGAKCFIEYRSKLVRPDRGEPYISGIGRDVTERIQNEKQLGLLQKQLFQSQKMEAVGALAGGVAHDFNNILQAISGYVQLMSAAGDRNPRDRNHIMQIEGAVKRATDLVHRLLTFSHKIEPDKRPLDLNRQVSQAVKMLERTIPKMVRIKLNLAADLHAIKADPNQLEQILLNLGSNARDAMPEGGELLIETKNVMLGEDDRRDDVDLGPGEYVALTVSDTGTGMDQKTLERIFEPFFTTKGVGEGTGLGLSTAFGIVESHGGRITCRSELGRGTEFAIYLPAWQGDLQAARREQGREDMARGSETILVVDDDQAVRDVLRQILTMHGYRVRAAVNGEDALDIQQGAQGVFDLAILDLGMPGMGGAVCLRKLLENDPGLPVLVASGYAGDNQAEQMTAAGAAGFIGKPYRMAEMLGAVRDILDQRGAGKHRADRP